MTPRGSFRTRMVATASLLAILLAALTLYAEHLVRDAARSNRADIKQHSLLSQQVDDLKYSLQVAESQIYQYPLLLDKQLPAKIAQSLDDSLAKAALLRDTRFDEYRSSLEQALTRLHTLLKRLREDAGRLVEVLSTVEGRYPGMTLIQQALQPINIEFIDQANMALGDTPESHLTRTQQDIYRRISQVRYNWAQQASTVRVFVANRSGVFGDPESSMQFNLANREIYSDQIRRGLDELMVLSAKGLLTMTQVMAVETMDQLWRDYERVFVKVTDMVFAENWRKDIELVRARIRPMFDHAWKTLYEIDRSLKDIMTDSTSKMVDTSGAVTSVLSGFTIVVYLLIIAAYLGFEHTIRRPMVDIAHALRAEGRGEKSDLVLRSYTQETALLADAFQDMQEQVRSRQERLQTILNNIEEGVVTFDADGTIETFNASAQQLFEYRADEVVGNDVRMLVADQNHDVLATFLLSARTHHSDVIPDFSREIVGRRREGTTFPMAMKIRDMRVGNNTLFTAIVSDVTERQVMVEHLKNMAERDLLTGLSNRYAFTQELDRFVTGSGSSGMRVGAVLCIDIDNIKYVNDTMGHHAGDRAIMEVSEILSMNARPKDLVARVGGDEFAVLMRDTDDAEAAAIADEYRRRFDGYKLVHNEVVVDVTCSIGGSVLTDDVRNKEELFARADLACHVAKRHGRNRVHFYTVEDEKSLQGMSEDIRWMRLIKQALETDRFALALQPIVDTVSGRVAHYEVLLRMRDDADGLIMPSGFMPAAERFGMAVEIDEWVIRNALALLAGLKLDDAELRLTINISGASMGDPVILETLTNAIRHHSIDPTAITIEVTETVAISNLSAAIEFLEHLKSLGCKAALDDFGSGYSSFAYLKDLPVDYVKIDGSFVCDMERNELHRVMVRSMNEVAHAMGKKTVAEFVENERCLDALKAIRVDFVQGYHLGAPKVYAADMSPRRTTPQTKPSTVVPLFDNKS